MQTFVCTPTNNPPLELSTTRVLFHLSAYSNTLRSIHGVNDYHIRLLVYNSRDE